MSAPIFPAFVSRTCAIVFVGVVLALVAVCGLMHSTKEEPAAVPEPAAAKCECEATDLSICKLRQYNAEDYKRLYKESYDECDAQRERLLEVARRCQDSLAKVIGAPEGTEVLP